MGLMLCRRCRHHNRGEARYCATCGCPARPVKEPGGRVPSSTGGSGVVWVVLALVLIVAVWPVDGDSTATEPSLGRPQVRGLIIDFPIDYPADHFSTDRRSAS